MSRAEGIIPNSRTSGAPLSRHRRPSSVSREGSGTSPRVNTSTSPACWSRSAGPAHGRGGLAGETRPARSRPGKAESRRGELGARSEINRPGGGPGRGIPWIPSMLPRRAPELGISGYINGHPRQGPPLRYIPVADDHALDGLHPGCPMPSVIHTEARKIARCTKSILSGRKRERERERYTRREKERRERAGEEETNGAVRTRQEEGSGDGGEERGGGGEARREEEVGEGGGT